MGACVVTNGGIFSLFTDPHAFERHLHLVNRANLETALRAEVFVNESDHQVRAAHKILRYKPIQRSFAAPKSVIRAKDPRLQQIIVAEHGFFLPGESSAQRAAETEEGRDEVQEQVIELNQFEDEFGAFEQLDTPEDPLVTQAIRLCPRLISKGPHRKPTWVLRGNCPRAFVICSRASQGNHSRSFPLLPLPSPNTPRPSHRPPSRHPPNSPSPSSRLIPRGRGLPREKNPRTGENPVPLMRRTRAGGL